MFETSILIKLPPFEINSVIVSYFSYWTLEYRWGHSNNSNTKFALPIISSHRAEPPATCFSLKYNEVHRKSSWCANSVEQSLMLCWDSWASAISSCISLHHCSAAGFLSIATHAKALPHASLHTSSSLSTWDPKQNYLCHWKSDSPH